jgi:DNA-binding response OmpR family regulator
MSGRILIIEDEARIADFLLRGLTEEGYRVEHFADGDSARIALATGGWDVVLLDWWLPGSDGIELLREFRNTNRSTPVLFLTARDAISNRVEGLNAGADDYLCKPFSFEELLARVRALLRRRDQSSAVTIEFGDIHADLTTQRATRAGIPLDLTAKEFSLLVLFLRRPGAVLSRTRIYESVWGDRYDGLSNTIEVHVKELRRKLEKVGPRVVQTRRGQGYVLEAIIAVED